jgi:hypothetical protein
MRKRSSTTTWVRQTRRNMKIRASDGCLGFLKDEEAESSTLRQGRQEGT